MIYSPKQYRRGRTHNSYLFLILFSAVAAELRVNSMLKRGRKREKKERVKYWDFHIYFQGVSEHAMEK